METVLWKEYYGRNIMEGRKEGKNLRRRKRKPTLVY